MEAKLLKDPNSKCDYVLVSADEQSISYLNSGLPLRIAFFIDNHGNLPWYKRKAMVIVIAKDLDFEKQDIYKKGFVKKGLVDKSYLIDYIQKMKKKLIQMAMQELDVLDIPEEPMTTNLMIENITEPEPQEEISEPKEFINANEASEMLKVSYPTVINLAKKSMIRGEYNSCGWCFVKSDIEQLLKDKPEFLRKIWNDPKSVSKRESYYSDKSIDNELFVHIRKAEKIIKLSKTTITLYAKRGDIRNIKERGKDYYISVKHMEELKANPPDWLKKSWSYFNNGKKK
ncbi:MAG: hypothetical protein AB1629_04430 [Candidatus Omnitrophota bacterium]